MKNDVVTDYEMDINQYQSTHGVNSPGYKAVKKAIKEIAVENYIKGLYKKDATQKKG